MLAIDYAYWFTGTGHRLRLLVLGPRGVLPDVYARLMKNDALRSLRVSPPHPPPPPPTPSAKHGPVCAPLRKEKAADIPANLGLFSSMDQKQWSKANTCNRGTRYTRTPHGAAVSSLTHTPTRPFTGIFKRRVSFKKKMFLLLYYFIYFTCISCNFFLWTKYFLIWFILQY